MKKLIIILLCILFNICNTIAQVEQTDIKISKNTMTIKEIDKYIENELELDTTQKEQLKVQRMEYKKNLDSYINEMQTIKEKINEIYLKEQNKLYADIQTAILKNKLVRLKEKIVELKKEHREKFEANLNDKQKKRFQELRDEFKSIKFDKTYN